MANYVRIELETVAKKMKIDGDKVVIDHSYDKYLKDLQVNVLACCDELRCHIGSCKATKEEVDKIAGPENIINSLQENLSEYEHELMESVLSARDNKYLYNNKEFTALEPQEEEQAY